MPCPRPWKSILNLFSAPSVAAVQLVDQVGATDATQLVDDVATLFGLVPEEELALGQLLALRLGAEHGFEGVGMVTCVPRLRADGHGRGREVLHLLQVEIEPLGDDGQFGHVFLVAAGVAGDEVGDELLAQALLLVDAVENLLECLELGERRLAHDAQHTVAGVLGGHLEASADVAGDEFAGVFAGALVHLRILALMEQEVVAHTASDERLLDTGQGIDGVVDVEQRAVVGIQVGTHLGMDARRPLALLAQVEVGALHAVHVGAGSAQVAQVALEVGQLHDGLHFAQDALLATAHDELALMGGDGAEGASAEASAVDVDRVLDHVVGGDALALVLGMGQARVGQVERMVELLGCQGRVGRIDYHQLLAYLLQDARGGILVAFFLDVAEIGGLLLLVLQAFFVGVEGDVALYRADFAGKVGGLGNVVQRASLHQAAGQFDNGLLTHAIDEQVGSAIHQDAGAHTVLPIVVVRQASHTGLDASQEDGHVGEESFQDLRIDDGGVFGAHVGARVGRIGIVAAQAFVGGVFVHHGVHATGRYAEEQARTTQLLEVSQVVAPVGLGDDGHTQPFRLQYASDDGGAERGMIHIGIAAEDNYVQFVPPAEFHFFFGRGQPICQSVFFHGHKDTTLFCKLHGHLLAVVDFAETDVLFGQVFLQVVEGGGIVHDNLQRLARGGFTQSLDGGNEWAVVRCAARVNGFHVHSSSSSSGQCSGSHCR